MTKYFFCEREFLVFPHCAILISISDQAIGMQLAALHQHQGQLLRVVCVNGLSGYKLDSVSKVTELKDHSTAILKAVMATIGDELDSEVNYYGLIALTKLMVSLPLGKIPISYLLEFGQGTVIHI